MVKGLASPVIYAMWCNASLQLRHTTFSRPGPLSLVCAQILCPKAMQPNCHIMIQTVQQRKYSRAC